MSTLNDLAPRVPDEIPTISELIEKGLSKFPDKSQAEIAREMGFSANQTSMLSMIKKGTSRLKISRVPRMVRVLGLEPVEGLAAYLKDRTEDDPEAWAFISYVLNGTHDARELQFLKVLRQVEAERHERLELTPEKAARLKEFIAEQLFI